MKKSRFTETQIVSILKQADAGVPIKDICRQATVLGFPLVVSGRARTAAAMFAKPPTGG